MRAAWRLASYMLWCVGGGQILLRENTFLLGHNGNVLERCSLSKGRCEASLHSYNAPGETPRSSHWTVAALLWKTPLGAQSMRLSNGCVAEVWYLRMALSLRLAIIGKPCFIPYSLVYLPSCFLWVCGQRWSVPGGGHPLVTLPVCRRRACFLAHNLLHSFETVTTFYHIYTCRFDVIYFALIP
jgi:hypothetical protein